MRFRVKLSKPSVLLHSPNPTLSTAIMTKTVVLPASLSLCDESAVLSLHLSLIRWWHHVLPLSRTCAHTHTNTYNTDKHKSNTYQRMSSHYI